MTLSQPPKQNDHVRVLLVDDEVRILTVLSHVLRVTHDVVTARNGREALQLLKRVDEARSKLAGLKNAATMGEGVESEIRQLESFIAANSRQAEQAITERFRQRTNGDRTLS